MTTTNQSTQIMSDLKDIINESFSTKQDSYTPLSFNLKRVINEALESSNYSAEVIKFIDPFNKALENGVNESLIIDNLCQGLTLYSKSIPSMVNTVNSLATTINENRASIEMNKMFESIASPSLKSTISDTFNNFMSSPTMENRGNLIMMLESVGAVDQAAMAMLQYLNGPSVAYTPEVINLYDNVDNDVNEAASVGVTDEQKQQLLEKMQEYVNNKLAESNAPKKKSYKDIDNDIKLYETIDHLRKTVNDAKLNDVLDLYESALNDGCREEMIYETFINRLNEEFSYWGEVCDQTNAMEKRISTHKANISFTKILETLSNDGTWSYLVPIIEDVVVAYEEDPNIINRNILMNHLRMYDSCPYVRDVMQIANTDNSKEGLLMKESSQFISQRAHVEDVYSPVQYIKENECIFNVENQFYVKKGKNIAKLNKESIANLSESFLALAKIINDPNVEINEAENKITYHSEYGAPFIITENQVMVGDKVETPDTLKNVNEMHMRYQDYTDIDFLTAAFLCENFNNIAKVDFVKKVSMNEGSKTLDVFKVSKNIYVASHDALNEEHTFYRNVKPLQVKNIINEHFGIDVGNLFEDLLPNQDQLARELVLIKEEYQNKIEKLNDLKEHYESAIEEAELYDPSKKSLFEAALVEIKKEIKNVTTEFLKFQKKVSNLSESNVDSEKVEGILNDAQEALGQTSPDDFDDAFNSGNGEEIEDLDGSEDIDGSDIDFDDNIGSENNEDIDDGSDFDITDFELDGSDEDEFTSSDGDVMTDPITGDFSTDNTDLLSQDDDYILDDKDNNDDTYVDEEIDAEDNPATEEPTEQPTDEEDDLDLDIDDEIDDEDDPFGKDTAALQGEMTNEPEGDNIAGNEETEQVDDDADLDYANFKIVKVDFDINMRTGEKKPTGKAIVIVPMVDGMGNKTSDTKNIDFYVTEINGEKAVVLNSDGLSLEMYNAVCDAVKGSSTFNEVEPQASEADDEIDINDEDETPIAKEGTQSAEEIAADEANAEGPENHDEVFDTGSDETTVLSIDDGIEPHGIDITDVNDDDDEKPAETPAESSIIATDGEKEYEGLFDIDEIPEGKKAKKGSKRLNESEEIDINDDGEGDTEGIELDITDNQEDPIAVVKEVLDAYVDEGGNCEVGDINDYDVDGIDVNSINARIGENDYTFFCFDDQLFCSLANDFEENSQDIDTLRDWAALEEDENDEAPMCANVEVAEGDTQAWVDFVTDVIKIETGEDIGFDVAEVDDDHEEVEVEAGEDPEPTEEEVVEESAKVVLKKK